MSSMCQARCDACMMCSRVYVPGNKPSHCHCLNRPQYGFEFPQVQMPQRTIISCSIGAQLDGDIHQSAVMCPWPLIATRLKPSDWSDSCVSGDRYSTCLKRSLRTQALQHQAMHAQLGVRSGEIQNERISGVPVKYAHQCCKHMML